MTTPEGYATPTVTSSGVEGYRYVYQFKDHLDNVRLSYTKNDAGTLEIIEENNYYPFGLAHQGYNSSVSSLGNSTAQLLGFGGKEEQDELGLGWIDITARNYDPAIGRWMNLDPLAEQMRRHSPYNYAFDNPIYFMDPDGMKPFGAINSNGNCCNGLDRLARAVKRTWTESVARSKTQVKEFFAQYNDSNTIGSGVQITGSGDMNNEFASKSEYPEDDVSVPQEVLNQASSLAKSGGGKSSTKSGRNTGKKKFDKPENWATKMNKGINDAKDQVKKRWSVIEKNVKTINNVTDEVNKLKSKEPDTSHVTLSNLPSGATSTTYHSNRASAEQDSIKNSKNEKVQGVRIKKYKSK